jgi:cytochrome P450
VDFRRQAPIPIATFGNGPHKCPGANLARQELRIALEEWLPRIPDFEVVPDAPTHPATGLVSVMRSLHLCW